MMYARHLASSFSLLAVAVVGCGGRESATPARPKPESTIATPGLSARVAGCPGAAREETHTLATMSCYEEACGAGDVSGCSILGTFYLRGKLVARNPTRAVELFQRACDANYGLGCFGLASHYSGFMQEAGAAVDAAKALHFAERTCALDVGIGCGMAGGMYLRGHGTAEDKAHAKTLFQRGCSLSHDTSCEVMRKLEPAGATR